MTAVVQEAEALMAEYMKGYDSSHDMHHVRRVRDTALQVAASAAAAETRGVDMLVVELGAIFHDLVDHKYTADASRIAVVQELLQRHGLAAHQIEDVVRIIENTGFSKERRLREAREWTPWHETSIEFHSVQDADRLDAIGAFGIMRVSAYACRAGHALMDGTGPDRSRDSAYEHFYDKLLTLHETMRTPLGKRLAAERHEFMLAFLVQLRREYALTA